jgi:hypothetical protein
MRPAIGKDDAAIGTLAGDGVVGLVAVDLKDTLEVEQMMGWMRAMRLSE